MNASQACIDLIKSFESCKLAAYPDPKTGAAPWTVGWGATGPDIARGTVWTQQQADDRLQSDIEGFVRMANAAIEVPLTQGQFDAFVSILFNVGPGNSAKDGILRLRAGGPSTLLRKLNAGDFAGAAAEWPKWCSPGTSVTAGLLRRRMAERALFLQAPSAPPETDSALWGNEVRR